MLLGTMCEMRMRMSLHSEKQTMIKTTTTTTAATTTTSNLHVVDTMSQHSLLHIHRSLSPGSCCLFLLCASSAAVHWDLPLQQASPGFETTYCALRVLWRSTEGVEGISRFRTAYMRRRRTRDVEDGECTGLVIFHDHSAPAKLHKLQAMVLIQRPTRTKSARRR